MDKSYGKKKERVGWGGGSVTGEKKKRPMKRVLTFSLSWRDGRDDSNASCKRKCIIPSVRLPQRKADTCGMQVVWSYGALVQSVGPAFKVTVCGSSVDPASTISLTPSLPPRSDRRPKHVFYSSTAYTVHSPV